MTRSERGGQTKWLTWTWSQVKAFTFPLFLVPQHQHHNSLPLKGGLLRPTRRLKAIPWDALGFEVREKGHNYWVRLARGIIVECWRNPRWVCSAKEGRRNITLGAGYPSQAPISYFRVIYKMDQVCEWCIEMASKLGAVILEQGNRNLFFSSEANHYVENWHKILIHEWQCNILIVWWVWYCLKQSWLSKREPKNVK